MCVAILEFNNAFTCCWQSIENQHFFALRCDELVIWVCFNNFMMMMVSMSVVIIVVVVMMVIMVIIVVSATAKGA